MCSAKGGSDIAQCFAGKKIFLTGATGFLGKVLLEKLLRVCYDLKRIYILVRPKKGQTVEERLGKIFDSPCFDELKKQRRDFRGQLSLINGNCEEPNLGITDKDQELLQNEIDIVIHSAAIVSFDQKLRLVANINVRAVKDLISMAKNMPNLKAFVYISTAYSFCPFKQISEEFYKEPISADELFRILKTEDDESLTKITPSLLGKWPNTYVYTKAIAESVIQNEGGHLPFAIVRPAIITASLKEPMPGWIDNFQGIIGVVVGAAVGAIHSIRANPECKTALVPVDFVANHILAAAWDLTTTKRGQTAIYNYVGSNENAITWGQFDELVHYCGPDYPTEKMIWHVWCKLRFNLVWHRLILFFFHTIPALFIDLAFLALGKKPVALKTYKKIHKMLSVTDYFRLHSWYFHHENVDKLWNKLSDADKENFNFQMKNVNWARWANDCIIGSRIYLLKDPLETLPKARDKMQTLRVAHHSILAVLGCSIFFIIITLFGLL